jgi:adenosylhomocysteine nucleosidase
VSLSSPKLGIIAAVELEVQDILKNPAYEWQKKSENHYVSPHNVALIVSGIGKVNATYALSKIINSVEQVLMIGTSGGLGQQEIGTVYISTEFVEHDMDASGLGAPIGVTPLSWMKEPVLTNADPEFVSKIYFAFSKLNVPLQVGRTISGDQFLQDPVVVAEKIKLFKGDLVDMESAAVAKICVQEKKPFMALRYVTDNANHEAHTSWLEQVHKSSAIMNNALSVLLGLDCK